MSKHTHIIELATLLLLVCTQTRAQQAPRPWVLVEEFTNQGCSPCAAFSPSLDTCVTRHMGDVAFITYHINFPQPSDYIYVLNKEQNEARQDYYGVTGVPSIFFNGTRGYAIAKHADYLDAQIGEARKDPTFNIQVDASLNNGQLDITTHLTPIEAYSDRKLKLVTAVVEDYVGYDHKVWNGEDHWNFVMRQLLPNASGEQLPSSQYAGNELSYHCSWQVSGFDNEDELGIVSFVQDDSTHEVLATVYTPRPTGSNDAAKILKVEDTPDRICQPLYSSTIVFRNTGQNNLTSANLNVSINGTVQTTPWTGNLPYLAIDTVATPDFTSFALAADGAENDVRVWLSDINGTSQSSPQVTVKLNDAYAASNAVRLTMKLDNKPEETTWLLLDGDGNTIEQGGPYSTPGERIYHTFALNSNGCYKLIFRDSGDNGISGTNGTGYYKLDQMNADGTHKMLVQDTYTGSMATVNFSLSNASTTLGITSSAQAEADKPSGIYDLSGRKLKAVSHQGIYITNNKKQVIINK